MNFLIEYSFIKGRVIMIINKSDVKNISSQIRDNNDAFLGEVANLQNAVNNIMTVWSGDDATKYKELMESIITGLNHFHSLIESYTVFLSNVPGVYDTIDESYSNRKVNS